MSRGSSRTVVMRRATSLAGIPIGTTFTRPANSTPAPVTSPRLSPAKVTVSVARTAGPAGGPPSAGSPEGMSSAATGRPLTVMSSITRATRPPRAPRAPVPSRASTTRAARRRSLATAAAAGGAAPPGGRRGGAGGRGRGGHRPRGRGEGGGVRRPPPPPLRTGGARQLDVQRALGQSQNPHPLGARGRVEQAIGGLHPHPEARRLRLAPPGRLADPL